MTTKFFYALACLLGIAAIASSQEISCYDCDVQTFKSECLDPVGNNVRDVRCQPDVANGTSICLSAFLKYTGDKANNTGIYRGCRTLRPDVRDYCDWFTQEYASANLSVSTCTACNTTRCNKSKFSEDGSPGGGANSISTTVFALVVNAMFVILLNLFK